MSGDFDIVILGLTVTSSWGNGHATTYRSLVRGLSALGYRILFLERDRFWYAENRDEPNPRGATTIIYNSVDELIRNYERQVAAARLVIVGSFVPDGIHVGEWVTSVAHGKTAFYDIDTPLTIAQLEAGNSDYINPSLISKYDLYLSFTGGPTLKTIETAYGSPMARALYCSVDTDLYRPAAAPVLRWDLGYLGTYSDDRQPALEALLLSTARSLPESRFIVAGPQYPETLSWPPNVERTIHLSPREHPEFYGAQRFTLNITREAMKAAGYAPSVRLFEAGACATPIISDWWEGLDSILRIDEEVLIASNEDDVLRYLHDLTEAERLRIADAARRRILAEHTPTVRVNQLEQYVKESDDHVSPGPARGHGRTRKSTGGLANGVGPERFGKISGHTTGAAPLDVEHSGNLHEPSGKSS